MAAGPEGINDMNFYDPEPEEEWTKPRRAMQVIDDPMWPMWIYIHFGSRFYHRRRDTASAHRVERLCKAAWPEVNGLILDVAIADGMQITVTRPGYEVEA